MKFATKTIRYNPPHRRIRRPTGLSVRYHGRRVFIGRLCSGLFVRTCVWNVSRGAVHSSWQMLTALLAWSALSFCFRSSCSMPPTLFSLRTKRCSRSLRLTVGRTKSVADCGNFWRRSLAFSSVRALRGLPLPGRLITVHVSRNFLNSLLTPRFVQLFSGNLSVNLLLCIPSSANFLSKSCPCRLIPCWLLTNTAVTSVVTNFRCHKLIAKVNMLKEEWLEKFYLQSVLWKILYFKHRKYQKCVYE